MGVTRDTTCSSRLVSSRLVSSRLVN
ncbi:MAG: hypothetical protein J07HR59_01559, partial [Halorubrum sp. J07HR59]